MQAGVKQINKIFQFLNAINNKSIQKQKDKYLKREYFQYTKKL